MTSRRNPEWGQGSRFYLPNEDATMVRKALAALPGPARKPVFVGGSGMVLLDALADLPDLETATFVDVAAFQERYFERLLAAFETARSASDLRDWFAAEVYPELSAHFMKRGQAYPLANVMAALEHRFSIRFFFEDSVFQTIRRSLSAIRINRTDVLTYLASRSMDHDFIYLSNVPDYLGKMRLVETFRACREMEAPVYLLLTSACENPDLVRGCWENNGYSRHAVSSALSAQNQGLGSHALNAAWNRPGDIHLLTLSTN